MERIVRPFDVRVKHLFDAGVDTNICLGTLVREQVFDL